MAVSVSNVDLMERVCHLTNKIYREMSCIIRYERLTYITTRIGPASRPDHVQASAFFSRTPQYKIVISWDLLDWISVDGRIPRSFTNLITIPELSGPFHISPDIYHTQITEYLL